MRFLTNVDMSKNELQNVVIHPTSEAPSNPRIGQLYTDMSGEEPVLVWWNGKKWAPLGEVIPENVPTRVLPSISIKLDEAGGSAEVGEASAILYEVKFNPGSYTYGPATGVTVQSCKVSDNSVDANVSNSMSGKFENIVPGTDKYTITAEVTYSDGAVPVTDRGNPYPEAQILSDKVVATVAPDMGSAGGFRKYFYGASAEVLDLNSDSIRSLTHSTGAITPGTTFDISIPNGTNQVIIAFPTEAGLSLESVIDTGAFSIDVYDIFTKTNVDVEGANGYEAISYDVYVYTPDVTLGKNKYVVTIS